MASATPSPTPSPTQNPDPSAGRLRQLDVLRGVAILLVLGRHFDVVPTDAPAVVQGAVDLWLRAGWIGVDLFFVLSGFLVSGLLFREYARYGDVRGGRFLLRRGLKIYPAFYVFLIATALITGTIGTRRFAAEALFVQNYVPGLSDHTWSLAVEEHFYLLLTVLILALVGRSVAKRRGRSHPSPTNTDDPFAALVPIFIGVAIVALILRIITARYGSAWYRHHLCPTHLRIDSLLFGVLLSYLAHYRGPDLAAFVRGHRDLLLLAAILCLAPACFLPAINVVMETVGFTLLYLGFGIVLLLTLYQPAPEVSPAAVSGATQASPQPGQVAASGQFGGDVAGNRVMADGGVTRGAWRGMGRSIGAIVGAVVAWIGVYSYSIYLWHLAVKRWGVPAIVRAAGLAPTGTAALLVYLVAAIVIGAVMARLVESPGLAIRDRWFPSRSGRVAKPVGLVDSVPAVGAYI